MAATSHSRELDLVSEANFPSAHCLQYSMPSSPAVFPGLQGMQLPSPTEYCEYPVGQATQLAGEDARARALKRPIAHILHALLDSAPTSTPYLPTLQLAHTVEEIAPEMSLHVPLGHASQGKSGKSGAAR